MHTSGPDSPAPLLVVCLCAAWCGSCREYDATFKSVAAGFPEARFVWVDIEDEADRVEPVDVDNFPTVLIARDGAPRFFGPLMPQRDTLARLVRAHAGDSALPALVDPALVALTRRLHEPLTG